VKNRIYVQNVKARDFQPCEPFIIEGRPQVSLVDQIGPRVFRDAQTSDSARMACNTTAGHNSEPPIGCYQPARGPSPAHTTRRRLSAIKNL
jgi:hypothetical protein